MDFQESNDGDAAAFVAELLRHKRRIYLFMLFMLFMGQLRGVRQRGSFSN
jgi:hypothetical protein